jgi:hypothetical protein
MENLKDSFRNKTVTLYSTILEYQIRLAVYCSRKSVSRYFSDVLIHDDWKQLLTDVEDVEKNIDSDLRRVDSYRMKEVDKRMLKQIQISNYILASMDNIIDRLEARLAPN